MKALAATRNALRGDSPVRARPAPVSVVSGGESPLPPHLRSALIGAGVGPRLASPGYMQATNASAAYSAARPISRQQQRQEDAANLPPAGGNPNIRGDSLIDYERGEPRHTQRRIIVQPQRSNPATTAGIATPMRGQGMESPRFSSTSDLFAETSTGVSAARSRPASASTRRPPLAPGASTHDKSLPNARRSQRGVGRCLPAPELSSAASLAASADMIEATALPRRASGVAKPMVARPADMSMMANPPTASALPGEGRPKPTGSLAYQMNDLRTSGYIGMASGSVADNHLGGRRARGLCSPRPASSNPLAWNTD